MGISVILVLIGSSIGPVIASAFMQTFQESIGGDIYIYIYGETYPAPLSYDLVFLTATVISLISFPCMILLRKRTLTVLSKRVEE